MSVAFQFDAGRPANRAVVGKRVGEYWRIDNDQPAPTSDVGEPVSFASRPARAASRASVAYAAVSWEPSS